MTPAIRKKKIVEMLLAEFRKFRFAHLNAEGMAEIQTAASDCNLFADSVFEIRNIA